MSSTCDDTPSLGGGRVPPRANGGVVEPDSSAEGRFSGKSREIGRLSRFEPPHDGTCLSLRAQRGEPARWNRGRRAGTRADLMALALRAGLLEGVPGTCTGMVSVSR